MAKKIFLYKKFTLLLIYQKTDKCDTELKILTINLNYSKSRIFVTFQGVKY